MTTEGSVDCDEASGGSGGGKPTVWLTTLQQRPPAELGLNALALQYSNLYKHIYKYIDTQMRRYIII